MNLPGKTLRCVLAATAALLISPPSLAHADIYVIANSALAVRVDDIRLIYTGDMELFGSKKIRSLDNRSAQQEFLSKVLGLNVDRYDSLWTMKCFRDGLTPPTVKENDSEVIAYVQKTPGAIGYVTSAPPPDVLLLKKF
jgi:hypothetical protein